MTRAHDSQNTLPQRRCTSCTKTPSQRLVLGHRGKTECFGVPRLLGIWSKIRSKSFAKYHLHSFPGNSVVLHRVLQFVERALVDAAAWSSGMADDSKRMEGQNLLNGENSPQYNSRPNPEPCRHAR